MKILAIRLKNLASLAGPLEIDFTAEPLASAGLFAITGPTGAGKSTLLDALCLALFGAVPRLSKTGRDGKVPETEGEIATGDPRTLLRRGTGTGFAEVDFLGIDGRRYRARWEANRARDKAGGKLQPSRQSLYDLDAEQLLTSLKPEFKAMLEACLGLNFEQFTRAVLLAQSEFSAFLKADDNERSELLEKLTDTALYTRLGRRAFEQSKEAREALRLLQEQAGGIAPLASELREGLDLRLENARLQLKTEQARFKQLEQQQQWQRELQRLQDERQATTDELQQATQAWQDQAAARQDLSRLEQLAPQRHLFIRSAELQAQLSPLTRQIDEQQRRQLDLQSRQLERQNSQADAHAALNQALQAQSDAAPKLRQAFEAHSTLAHLNQTLSQLNVSRQAAELASSEGQARLLALRERQQASEQRLAQITAQLQQSAELATVAEAWNLHRQRLQQIVQLSARLGKGREELPAIEQRATQAESELAARHQRLNDLYAQADCPAEAVAERLQSLTRQLQESRLQLRSLDELERHWLRQQELEQRVQVMRQAQQQAGEQRELRTREGVALKAEHQEAEQALNVTLQVLQRQRLARSASVEQLRGQLQDDQPCPVCGSIEHPWHQSDALLQALGSHEEGEETRARETVQKLADRLAELRAEVQGLIEQQKQLKPQEEQLLGQQQSALQQLQEHPLFPQMLEQPAQRRETWICEQLQQINPQVIAAEAQQNRLLALQQQANQLQHQLLAAQQACQAAVQQLNEQQRSLLNDSQRLDDELAAFSSLLPSESLEQLRHNPAAGFLELDRKLASRLEQIDQRRDEQQEFDARQRNIEQEQWQQQSREQELSTLQQRCSVLDGQLQVSGEQLSQLLGEHSSAQAWQGQLEQAVELARQSEAAANRDLQAIATEQVRLSSELKAGLQQQQAQEQALGDLQARVLAWRGQHPELDDEGLHALLDYSESQVGELRQQLQQSEKGLEQLRVRLQERELRLQTHQAQHNGNLDGASLEVALQQLHDQCTAQEQVCAELRAEQAEDQRRLRANQALQERIASANEQYQRWARVAALIGSATGDTFRKIAQAYNLDILLHHANAQLRQLVKRYRLKRGGSMLGLLVLDTEMGDELRSVHSLSGGETFLVSLALALGLASMASSTLKIESLFIDEGFGSLDPESLQLAMDALDGLQAQGRKVAVISHVQEMHERIPVQIQVRRQGNGLSSVEVSG
ncbi:AAA family ATPase [Pseudomonas sp. LS1212]|uniref:AAA family ATPase n=1 Tax=Pseudomonas sp. LS1212 TaxID=2972478 RepID=UPI00215D29A0|nr:AAA family ATPase [Pseudomonas sp. LS1212]UVJ42637.1 AAA family ATPase [Pseudomonas sp. LS1212]